MTSSANQLSPLFAGRGFIVQDLFLATGGQMYFPPIYEVGQVAAPGARRDVMGARYGIDLRFPGDLQVLPNKDLALTSGTEGARARLTRALVTEPGEIFWRPKYGVGIPSLLAFPIRAVLIAEVTRRIRASYEGEPDVDQIQKIDVSTNEAGNRLDVLVKFTLRGAQPIQAAGLRILEAA